MKRKSADASSQSSLKLGPHSIKPVPASALWLTSTQVRHRYGGLSAMWLWSKVNYDADFPKPVYLGNRQLYAIAELDAYDRLMMSRRVIA
jgi:hypothetical protein